MLCITLNTAYCKSGDIQLVSASPNRAGSVRVCVNGTWGKVCGGELNPNFASVVCRQLGYSPYGNLDILHLSAVYEYYTVIHIITL